MVVALAIGVAGLSACSSSEPATTPAESTAATSAAPASSAPSSSAPSSAETSAGSSDSGNGAKPSKEEVVAGYSKIVKGIMAELPDDIVKKVTSCFVDEVYDKASAKTLRAIADGDGSGIDPGDMSLFTDAQTACQKKLVG
ncbi:MAG: hypothetical protein QM650_17050 [Microlunatus sp.]